MVFSQAKNLNLQNSKQASSDAAHVVALTNSCSFTSRPMCMCMRMPAMA